MSIEFNPMRSMIFTDLAKEQYRHKLLKWHMLHVEDSIAQFEPYVMKYAFYSALPIPPEGNRFGAARFHLCEHHWLLNPFTPEEEGEKWLHEEVFPKLQAMPEVTRILSSHILQDVNNCPFSRVTEVWFEGPEEWYEACVVKAKEIAKPSFAQTNQFPYLTPQFNFTSIFITDIPYSDNYTQYRGYIAKR